MPGNHPEDSVRLSERAMIHAENMQSEGWYTTANVLAASAEALDEARAAVASIRTRVGQINQARENYTAQSLFQIGRATEALLQTADSLERVLSLPPSHQTPAGEPERGPIGSGSGK